MPMLLLATGGPAPPPPIFLPGQTLSTFRPAYSAASTARAGSSTGSALRAAYSVISTWEIE